MTKPFLRAAMLSVVCSLASTGCAGSARAIEPPPRPDVPDAKRMGGDVRLTWPASVGATRYEVYREARRIATTETVSFVDDEAPAGRTFYFVTACRSWACSHGSVGVTVSATTAVADAPAAFREMEKVLAACEIGRTELMLERDELRLGIGELLAKVGASKKEPRGSAGTFAGTFACLDAATDVVNVTGTHVDKYEVDGSPGRAWDAREFDAFTDHIRHGAVAMRGGTDSPAMCWAGGHVRSTRPLNASWAEHKATDDPDDPSRNSTAIDNESSSGIVTGMHVRNVADAFRNGAQNWLVQHSWAEYVRDDAIENDNLQQGRVHDVLFDGVYSGFSARPSSDNDEAVANGSVMTLERVLVRMEAQPYPYKWVEKGGNINAAGEPWREGDGIPYGHGNLFKIEKDEIPGRNVRWALRDTTIMATHRIGDSRKLNFPPDELLDECSGVTVIWTGEGEYPGTLPSERFPDCVTVVRGEAGLALWAKLVKDWHVRHPDVGTARKRAEPWRLEWPRSTLGGG